MILREQRCYSPPSHSDTLTFRAWIIASWPQLSISLPPEAERLRRLSVRMTTLSPHHLICQFYLIPSAGRIAHLKCVCTRHQLHDSILLPPVPSCSSTTSSGCRQDALAFMTLEISGIRKRVLLSSSLVNASRLGGGVDFGFIRRCRVMWGLEYEAYVGGSDYGRRVVGAGRGGVGGGSMHEGRGGRGGWWGVKGGGQEGVKSFARGGGEGGVLSRGGGTDGV
ncbi:hypothetical protein Tco_1266012 [Tanacetum coccineum]